MKKYIIMLIVFAITEIGLALYLTVWREHFWNAISNKQSLDFVHQLGVFLGVALCACFVSGLTTYLVQLSTIKWREVLNSRAVCIKNSRDMDVNYVGMPLVDNMSQRIQEDCTKYPELVLTLAFGTAKAILYIIVFSISLILSFKLWYLVVLVSYTIVGSALTSWIAKPLINLNYEQQKAEASYRSNLSISNFQDCVSLMLGIAKRTKYLTYFQQFYMQIAVVVPLILIAPTYFTSAMTVGMLMRFNSLSNTILDNMGYGISSWGQINMLLSCRRRLKEIRVV